MSSIYEQKIDALIPQAEREALERIQPLINKFEISPGIDGRTHRHCFRSEFFHQAMNRLAFEAGLRPML